MMECGSWPRCPCGLVFYLCSYGAALTFIRYREPQKIEQPQVWTFGVVAVRHPGCSS